MCTEWKLHSNWCSPADTPSLLPAIVAGLHVRYSRPIRQKFVHDERRLWTKVPLYFVSEDCWYFTENKVPCLLCLFVIFCVVILVFCKLLEANSNITLKNWFWCLWHLYWSQSLTDFEGLLYAETVVLTVNCHYHVCDITACWEDILLT
jgi:hypothetical protein